MSEYKMSEELKSDISEVVDYFGSVEKEIINGVELTHEQRLERAIIQIVEAVESHTAKKVQEERERILEEIDAYEDYVEIGSDFESALGEKSAIKDIRARITGIPREFNN